MGFGRNLVAGWKTAGESGAGGRHAAGSMRSKGGKTGAFIRGSLTTIGNKIVKGYRSTMARSPIVKAITAMGKNFRSGWATASESGAGGKHAARSMKTISGKIGAFVRGSATTIGKVVPKYFKSMLAKSPIAKAIGNFSKNLKAGYGTAKEAGIF